MPDMRMSIAPADAGNGIGESNGGNNKYELDSIRDQV
jgi:hypothetical protein